MAGILPGIISGATSLGAAIYGTLKSGKLNRQAEAILKGQQRDNQRWYDVKMAQDYTQRSDVQAAIKKQRELLNEQYDRARKTNVVSGGTDEALALQKQAANQSLSQTATDIASRAADYKDSVEDAYLNRKANLENQERQNLQQRAAAVAQAASQTVNSGLNMIGNTIGNTVGTAAGGTAVANPEPLKAVSAEAENIINARLAGAQATALGR